MLAHQKLYCLELKTFFGAQVDRREFRRVQIPKLLVLRLLILENYN